MPDALVAGNITVEPAEFSQVKFDANEIATALAALAGQLEITNPIRLVIDETTPLAKVVCALEAPTSDATILIEAQSGAIENTKQLTTFGPRQANVSLGRMLLRARDRLRPDFADVPADDDLSLTEHAAWDTYCAGRLARAGYEMNEQRWRYNHRNRFGFSDGADASFERLWSADDLGWDDLTAAA